MKGGLKVEELSDVFDALEVLREFCLGKNNCLDCELRNAPFCRLSNMKLKDLTFNNPNEPKRFSFFNEETITRF